MPLTWAPRPQHSLSWAWDEGVADFFWDTDRTLLTATLGLLRCVDTFFSSCPSFAALPEAMSYFYPALPTRPSAGPNVVRSAVVPRMPSLGTWVSVLLPGSEPVASEEKAPLSRRLPQHCFVAPAGGAGPAFTNEQLAFLEVQRELLRVLVHTEEPVGLEHFQGTGGEVPDVLRGYLRETSPSWIGDVLEAAACWHHRQLQEWGVRELGCYLAALSGHDDDDDERVQFWLDAFQQSGGLDYLMTMLGSVALRDPRGLRPTVLQGIRACAWLMHRHDFLTQFPLLASTLLRQMRTAWVTTQPGWKDMYRALVAVLANGGPAALDRLWSGGGVDELVELVRLVARSPWAPESADVIGLLGDILNSHDARWVRLLCDEGDIIAVLVAVRQAVHRTTAATEGPAAGRAAQDRLACLTAAAAQCTVVAVRSAPLRVLDRVSQNQSLVTTLRWIYHSYTGPGDPWREWDHHFPGIPLEHRARRRQWEYPEM